MHTMLAETNDELIRQILGGSIDPADASARLSDDLNLPNASGLTLAKAAVISGSPALLRLLFARGARADSELLEFAELRYPHMPQMRAEIVAAMMAKVIEGALTIPAPHPPRRRTLIV